MRRGLENGHVLGFEESTKFRIRRTTVTNHELSSAMAASTSPTSQTHPASLPPSVFTLPQTAQLEALYTIIRDRTTSRGDFLFYSDRIIRLLVEESLNHLPVVPKTVETPTVCRHVDRKSVV